MDRKHEWPRPLVDAFISGDLLITNEAYRACRRNGLSPRDLLERYFACDWGERCTPEDVASNHRALEDDGSSIKAIYRLRTGDLVYLTTDLKRKRSFMTSF